MSNLKMLERDCLEELFGMASGYVMDFSNRTFAGFFRESVHVDIYSAKYAGQGDSKAKRLRAFIEVEPDVLVGKVLSDLLEYWRYKTPQPDAKEQALADRARQVVERLLGKSVQPRDSGEDFLKQRPLIRALIRVGPTQAIESKSHHAKTAPFWTLIRLLFGPRNHALSIGIQGGCVSK